jgi:hypothetical protein
MLNKMSDVLLITKFFGKKAEDTVADGNEPKK